MGARDVPAIDPLLGLVLTRISEGMVLVGPGESVLYVNSIALAKTHNDPRALVQCKAIRAAVATLRKGDRPIVKARVHLYDGARRVPHRVSVCGWPLGKRYVLLIDRGTPSTNSQTGDAEDALAASNARVSVRMLFDRALETVGPLAKERGVRLTVSGAIDAQLLLQANEPTISWAFTECLAYLVLRAQPLDSAPRQPHINVELAMSSSELVLAMRLRGATTTPIRELAVHQREPNPDSRVPSGLGQRLSLARAMLFALGCRLDRIHGNDGWEMILLRLGQAELATQPIDDEVEATGDS
jgi:hypothetical protein